jgi:hypothetical protein
MSKKIVLNDDEVLKFDRNDNAVWAYGKEYFKAYTEDLETKRRLTKVAGSVTGCRYYDSKLGRRYWDFIIPNKRLSTAMRILSRRKKVGNS